MDTDDARKIIALLKQIRDGQQLQLQRQTEVLACQAEVFARQHEHFENLKLPSGKAKALQDRAEQIQPRSARLVAGEGARAVALIVVPFALLPVVFVCWLAFGHAAR